MNPFELVQGIADRYGQMAPDLWEVEAKALLQLLQRSRKGEEKKTKDTEKLTKRQNNHSKLLSQLIEEAQQHMGGQGATGTR